MTTEEVNLLLGIANVALVAVALAAAAIAWREMRLSRQVSRAELLSDLYRDLFREGDKRDAPYLIEYGRFEYGPEFHGSDLEPKVDQLLSFLDLVCGFRRSGVFSRDQFARFEYEADRVWHNSEVQKYIAGLSRWYEQAGQSSPPFANLRFWADRSMASPRGPRHLLQRFDTRLTRPRRPEPRENPQAV